MKVTSYTFCGKINIHFHDNLKYIKTKLVNPKKEAKEPNLYRDDSSYILYDSVVLYSTICQPRPCVVWQKINLDPRQASEQKLSCTSVLASG